VVVVVVVEAVGGGGGWRGRRGRRGRGRSCLLFLNLSRIISSFNELHIIR